MTPQGTSRLRRRGAAAPWRRAAAVAAPLPVLAGLPVLVGHRSVLLWASRARCRAGVAPRVPFGASGVRTRAAPVPNRPGRERVPGPAGARRPALASAGDPEPSSPTPSWRACAPPSTAGELAVAVPAGGARRAARRTATTATTPPTSRCSSPRPAGRPPREVAELRRRRGCGPLPAIASVEVAGPGFLNVRLDARPRSAAGRAHRRRPPAPRTAAATGWRGSGSTSSSSRPTRPARCTWAACAGPRSATRSARLLEAAGAEVDPRVLLQRRRRPDRPVRRLAAAPRARARRRPEDGYAGDYVAEIAAARRRRSARRARPAADEALEVFRVEGLALMFGEIRAVAGRLRRDFDVYFSRAHAARAGARSPRRWTGCASRATSSRPTARSGCGPPTSATTRTGCWSRATARPTYFAADCAYYLDKRERGFDRVVIMLGADHHGYVGRMRGDGGLLRRRPGPHPRAARSASW